MEGGRKEQLGEKDERKKREGREREIERGISFLFSLVSAVFHLLFTVHFYNQG